MSSWTSVKAAEVRPGDRIRVRDTELEVTRIDKPFLGREEMCCFVESTDERWACAPGMLEMDVEVERA